MIYYRNESKDPYYNLALEELLTKETTISDEILLLWQNDNAIIIGVNQNTIEEINNDYVKEHQVNVVRRLSGGGAVYHDLGNLNFTFIFNKNQANIRNYSFFTEPIITVLQKLGLNAQFSGKNDLEIDGKKISGNAQYLYKNRIMHHGTILFNVDLTILPKTLKPDLTKLQSKAIKSVQARVTNILPLLKHQITIEEFKALIIAELEATKNTKVLDVPIELKIKAQQLAQEKYRTWQWNYGNSPAFNWENKVRIPNKGTVDIKLAVEQGVIKTIKIYGDFLGAKGTKSLEQQLINQPYNYQIMQQLISEVEVKEIFGPTFTKEEILAILVK
ncbi:MAG: lipoate--protein ligase [Spiroplasma sp.]|nr:lipoate--protein ligase [Spiroplasma sp.]